MFRGTRRVIQTKVLSVGLLASQSRACEMLGSSWMVGPVGVAGEQRVYDMLLYTISAVYMCLARVPMTTGIVKAHVQNTGGFGRQRITTNIATVPHHDFLHRV